jgi:hypothetical protein
MARADWLARSIDDFLPRIDRGSNRDHQKLVTMLIGHEMHLKSAQRSEETGLPAARADNERDAQAPGWLQAARGARSDAVRKAGLTHDLAIANRYLGDRASSSVRPAVGVPEPIAPERVRHFGRPISFLGILSGIDESPGTLSLSLVTTPWWEGLAWPAGETILLGLVLLMIALLITFSRRGIAGPYLALFMVLGLAGYMGGPLILTGATVLAAAGWRKSRVVGYT